MTVKIVLPEGGGVKATNGTKVFTESGEEIESVSRIRCDWGVDDILTADITVAVSDIENFAGILPTLVQGEPPKDNGRLRTLERIRRGAK